MNNTGQQKCEGMTPLWLIGRQYMGTPYLTWGGLIKTVERIRLTREAIKMSDSVDSETAAEYKWESVPKPERLVEKAYFERIWREWCSCFAYRVGLIYKHPDHFRVRWELVEYDPNDGDPTKDTRAIAGGWGGVTQSEHLTISKSIEDAQQQCEAAYCSCLEKRGPL